MDSRIKSAIATTLIQGALAYVLIATLAMTISHEPDEKLNAVTITSKAPPPPSPAKAPPVVSPTVPFKDRPVVLHDWSAATPEQRNLDFMKVQQWRDANIPPAERRLAQWRAELPQGSGPGKVTREQPANLSTHTLYWPAKWTKGPLPIIAWGNDFDGTCSNSSLPYAAFLSEIASWGYFVVAVGNDDIDYPQPEGLAYLTDGRPLRVKANALNEAVDWAIAENARTGSPYQGRLDTSRVAYMGNGCGAGLALRASADPQTTTTVLLNSSVRFRPDAAQADKAPLVQFEGEQDDRNVIEAGEANLAKAQEAGWPMFKAALKDVGHKDAYPGPDKRWTKAVIAWLDWQLKGDGKAQATLGNLSKAGWSRVEATGILEVPE